MPGFKKTLGFSIVEVLIVILIISILAGISFYSFSNLNKREILEKETLKVLSFIQDARSLTLSSKNSSQYGVYFNTDSIIFFEGDSFEPSDPGNEVVNLSQQVSISSVALSGGSQYVVFERLSGKALQHGTVTLSLSSDGTLRNIRIFETGLSEMEQ